MMSSSPSLPSGIIILIAAFARPQSPDWRYIIIAELLFLFPLPAALFLPDLTSIDRIKTLLRWHTPRSVSSVTSCSSPREASHRPLFRHPSSLSVPPNVDQPRSIFSFTASTRLPVSPPFVCIDFWVGFFSFLVLSFFSFLVALIFARGGAG